MENDNYITFSVMLFLILLCIGSCSFTEYQCKTKAKIQNMQYSWGIIQGCMVKEKNGKWIDYERYRVME